MKVEQIYFGTWIPRTYSHLMELYNFLKYGLGTEGLDSKILYDFQKQLNVSQINFHENPDFNVLEFVSRKITVTITEDGIIMLTIKEVNNFDEDCKHVESFFINVLGAALAYLFSKGAPLPQALADKKEIYPRLAITRNATEAEALKFMSQRHIELLSTKSIEGLNVFSGKDLKIINISNQESSADLDKMIENAVFIDSYLDSLSRFLYVHRKMWEDVSLIRDAKDTRYRDFQAIRMKILDSLKAISFIQTRMRQMDDILRVRGTIVPKSIKQKLDQLGFENFKILESSSRYFENLLKMTADFVNSTLVLFESLVAENTQREIRLLQQFVVIGSAVGFFGMNIAFPWEERWPDVSISSFLVIGIIILAVILFNGIIRERILNRRFKISDRKSKWTNVISK